MINKEDKQNLHSKKHYRTWDLSKNVIHYGLPTLKIKK